MKKLFLPIVFFLLFPLTGCLAQLEQDSANTWDFGRVKEGLILKHDFVLKNESKQTLQIKGVNTSCGCTVSLVKKNTLLPLESTVIEVKFNTKGYLGPTQQFIYVNTDSLDKPIIKFIIKAEVVK